MQQEKYIITGVKGVMNYSNDEKHGDAGSPEKNAGIECPGEAEVLAYCEGWIAEDRCTELDKHFAECEKCIELLAVFALVSNDLPRQDEKEGSIADARKQAERVASLIDQDEERFKQ